MADLEGIGRAVHDINARDVTIARNQGGFRRFAVDVPVLGMGEVTKQIWFPQLYVEKPLHSWGVDIVGNADIPENATPICSVIVRSWNTEIVEDSGVLLYVGCRTSFRTYSPYASHDASLATRFAFTQFFEGKSIIHAGRERG